MVVKTQCSTPAVRDRVRWRNVAALLLACTISGCGGGGADGGIDIDGAIATDMPAAAPALPPTEVENAVAAGPTSVEDAYRLLDQASFGATLDTINDVAAIGPEAWIDRQMSLPATYLLPEYLAGDTKRWNEYINAWWRNAVLADDQLRQRVAFALSELFVVSSKNSLGSQQAGLANYYDVLLSHAFGNYRDLLEAVTLSPVMGEYLSMKGNRKPDPEMNVRPDENYAREVLQLFTIGQTVLDADGTTRLDGNARPLPSYDQSTIEGFAHVFTGWHFANADDFQWPRNKDFINPMTPWPEYHDTSAKQLVNGVTLPAGQSAERDLQMALDSLFEHPNVAPFIVRQLIQRLVTSNPTPGYVRDVAAVFERNAEGQRGSLGSTVKAILLHKEARRGHIDAPHHFGKAREPLLRVTQLWRAFDVQQMPPDFHYGWAANELAQAPLASPSVFNFFRPDYAQPGAIDNAGLVSPEFSIIDESSVITQTSRLLANSIWSHNHKDSDDTGDNVRINIDRELALEPDPAALLDHLDLLLLGGRMSSALRADVLSLMAVRDYDSGATQRVVEAIFLIVTSPEGAIQI